MQLDWLTSIRKNRKVSLYDQPQSFLQKQIVSVFSFVAVS